MSVLLHKPEIQSLHYTVDPVTDPTWCYEGDEMAITAVTSR